MGLTEGDRSSWNKTIFIIEDLTENPGVHMKNEKFKLLVLDKKLPFS